MQSVVVDDHDDHGDDDEIEVFSHPPLFSNEELNGIHGIKRGEGFIELDCGCTNATYGDSAGKFRIYGNGKLEVSCDCYPGCNGGTYVLNFRKRFKFNFRLMSCSCERSSISWTTKFMYG